MALIELDTAGIEPYRDGADFGTGPYERIDAVAHYAVDPTAPANQGIVDLELAPRDGDGLVRFEGDITILRPLEPDRSARRALIEVPNRGRRTALSLYNRAPAVLEPTYDIDPGDGFLFRHGWTVVWCGWQWDVPRSPARMGLAAPNAVGPDGQPIAGQVQLRYQLHQPTTSVALTDHHVGVLGGHTPLPTHQIDDPEAVLTVRDGLWGQPQVVPRSRWRFARQQGSEVVADDHHLWLDGGFEPGRIYDLVYRTRPCPVAGAGLLAVRDIGTYLRSAPASPWTGELDQLHVTGQSQCGRFLRTFLHHGLNRGEDGQRVYDGALIHIAGGRRGEFNHRAAQPSVQPTPGFGHRFPFADRAQTDPRTGLTDGLLERPGQDLATTLPLVMYTDTAAEYWRGDASLAHLSATGDRDLDLDAGPEDGSGLPGVRRYLLASTQHGPGLLPLMDESMFGSRGGNCFNVLDYTPLMRAALTNLAAWADGVEPPPSAVPRLSDGTATTRADALSALGALIGPGVLARPEADRLTTIRPLDLGPEADRGIGAWPAAPAGDSYPCLVSNLDADGNEQAGIRLPDVTVPVATHTGWNPRHPSTGAPEEILEYVGSTVPLAATAADRDPDDHRAPLDQRYRDEDDYRSQVRAAAEALVAQGYLLAEDIEVCERSAARRYRAVSMPAS